MSRRTLVSDQGFKTDEESKECAEDLALNWQTFFAVREELLFQCFFWRYISINYISFLSDSEPWKSASTAPVRGQ